MKSINNHIEQEILKIKNHSLVERFKTYAIKPKKIELIKNLETFETMSVWLLKEKINFAIENKIKTLKKFNYTYFESKIGKKWFESTKIENKKIDLEIEIDFDFTQDKSSDIRISVLGSTNKFFSFIFPINQSFSITKSGKILD